MACRSVFTFFLAGSLVLACSGGEGEPAAATGGSAGQAVANAGQGGSTQSAAGQAGGGQANGTSGDANSSAGAAGAGGTTTTEFSGTIQILSLYGTNLHDLRANFYRTPVAVEQPTVTGGCTSISSGACGLNTCEASSTTPAAVPPPLRPHAGMISFLATDLDDPTHTVTASLAPDASGAYAVVDLSSTLRGREAISISAPGADIPAFQIDVESPLRLLLTNAEVVAVSSEATLAISRTQDTVLTWDRGVDGVTFHIQGATAAQSITCTFPSLDGTGTIPVDLVSQFMGTELRFFTFTRESILQGDVSITVTGGYDVMTPDRLAAIVGVLE